MGWQRSLHIARMLGSMFFFSLLAFVSPRMTRSERLTQDCNNQKWRTDRKADRWRINATFQHNEVWLSSLLVFLGLPAECQVKLISNPNWFLFNLLVPLCTFIIKWISRQWMEQRGHRQTSSRTTESGFQEMLPRTGCLIKLLLTAMFACLSPKGLTRSCECSLCQNCFWLSVSA